MELTQEQIDLALVKIDHHFAKIGLQNLVKFTKIISHDETDELKLFVYHLIDSSLKTTLTVELNTSDLTISDTPNSGFSWMDYKKITE